MCFSEAYLGHESTSPFCDSLYLHPKLLVNGQELMRLDTWSGKYGSVGVSSVMHFGLEKYKSHT